MAANGYDVTVLSFDDRSIADDNVAAPPVKQILVRQSWFVASFSSLEHSDTSCFLAYSRRLFFSIVRNLFLPDIHRLMVRHCLREARLSERYDWVISSALPFSMHLIGKRLAREFGAKWVADNRDLWSASPYHKYPKIFRPLLEFYENIVLNEADLILGVTEAMVSWYQDILPNKPILLVRNGVSKTSLLEFEGLDQAINNTGVRIAYAGSLYGGRRDLSVLFSAIQSSKFLQDRVAVDLYGVERAVVNNQAKYFPDVEILIHDRLGKNQLVDSLRCASILLVVLGGDKFEKGVLTGKFFEYLHYRKPIFAIAPEDSELANLVTKYGVGYAAWTEQDVLRELVNAVSRENESIVTVPDELTIEFNMMRLLSQMQSMVS